MIGEKLLSQVAFCRKPRFVWNGYDFICVRCNECELCLSAKSSRLSSLCTFEEVTNKYCAFVTLTYDNHNLPKAFIPQLSLDEYNNLCSDASFVNVPLVSACERDTDNYCKRFQTIKFDIRSNSLSSQVLALYKRTCPRSKFGKRGFFKGKSCVLDDDGLPCIGYLLKSDYVLFLKRLRSLVHYNFPDEKLRFFVCGEYGSKTYRPHFHFLLWFNEPKLAFKLKSFVSQSWQYGAADYSLSRHKCGSYVSSYVNSFTRLPSFFTDSSSKIRSFSRHSNFLGQSIYKESSTYLVSDFSKVFTPFNVDCFGKVRTISPSLYDFRSFLPQIPFIRRHSDREVLQLFESVVYLSKEQGELSNLEFIRCLYNSDRHDYHFIYFLNYCSVVPDFNDSDYSLTYSTDISRLYSVYRSVLMIYYFFCDRNTLPSSVGKLYLEYLNFYYQLQLSRFYQDISLSQFQDPNYNIDFFYRNSLDLDDFLSDTLNNNYFVYKVSDFESRSKHKSLNDTFNILTAQII